jgi:hypothetical protein
MTSSPTVELNLSSTETQASLPTSRKIPTNGVIAIYLSKNQTPITLPKEQQPIFSFRNGILATLRHDNASSQTPISKESEVLILKPRRDITKIRKKPSTSLPISSHRFVLIIYKPFKEDHKRKSASRLIQRTPLIRIRPGVFLAPQIRLTRFRRYQKTLLRPSEFIQKMVENGAFVQYASRLEIFHPSSEEIIENLLQGTINERVTRIVNACRQLYREIRNRTPQSSMLLSIKKRFKRIRTRAFFLRQQALFFKQEFNIDFQNQAMRAYSAVSRVHQKLKLCDK